MRTGRLGRLASHLQTEEHRLPSAGAGKAVPAGYLEEAMHDVPSLRLTPRRERMARVWAWMPLLLVAGGLVGASRASGGAERMSRPATGLL